MRRKDRELTQKGDMQQILDSCQVCRLGLTDGEQPYVLPFNFGYAWPEDKPLTMYFHCAKEGRKLDILAKNNRVCFELDCGHQLLAGAKACGYSFAYASLLGFGRAQILAEAADKQFALQAIMERQAGPGEYNFSEAELASVVVFSVQAEELTGKQNAGR